MFYFCDLLLKLFETQLYLTQIASCLERRRLEDRSRLFQLDLPERLSLRCLIRNERSSKLGS